MGIQAMTDEDTAVQVRGYFDQLEFRDERFVVSGWMFLPGVEFDSIVVCLDGENVGEATRIEREDVAAFFSYIPISRNSGFSLNIRRSSEQMQGVVEVSVFGVSGGRRVGRLETWYRTDLYSCLPAPPPEHMSRVVNNDNMRHYFMTGYQSYKEYVTAIREHADLASINKMLDWGCGSGRLSGFFIRFSGIPGVSGCDIDSDAIDWCAKNLAPAEFKTIPFYPPTSYADDTFDLIVSYSVLTHLPKDVQLLWLEEMRRILAPGGLFLTTVHGAFAMATSFPGDEVQRILKEGIDDSIKDENLDGVAPEGYYRAVFQTKEYSVATFSKYFNVVDYKERGALNFQDLIVAKKC